jgi:hypothetical protein
LPSQSTIHEPGHLIFKRASMPLRSVADRRRLVLTITVHGVIPKTYPYPPSSVRRGESLAEGVCSWVD